jgi:hypothetical protein
VDDGAISTVSATAGSALDNARQGLEAALGWLNRNGLKADSDKTEAIIFCHTHHSHHARAIPMHLSFTDSSTGPHRIALSTDVHYLGIFLNHKLD